MSVNSGIKLQTAFLLRMYASALVHRRPCLQVGVYIRTHMYIYIRRERYAHVHERDDPGYRTGHGTKN